MKLLFLILLTVITTAAQTLRQEAERAGVLVSAAVRPAQLSEVAYASTLAREFNMLESENDLKWAPSVPIRQPSTSPKQTGWWASRGFAA
jgi:hypothetical protein